MKRTLPLAAVVLLVTSLLVATSASGIAVSAKAMTQAQYESARSVVGLDQCSQSATCDTRDANFIPTNYAQVCSYQDCNFVAAADYEDLFYKSTLPPPY